MEGDHGWEAVGSETMDRRGIMDGGSWMGGHGWETVDGRPCMGVHGGIEVHWRWGKAGLGKTRYVWEKHGLSVYTPTTYKW